MILLGFVFYSEGFRGRTSLFCLLRAQNCSTAGILPPARRQCNLHKNGLFSCFRDFFRQLRMLRPEFAGRKAYHGGNFSNILKSVFCGAVFYFAVGQLWHTNQLFRVLCASRALSLKSVAVNFGTQIGFFEFCVPAGRCLSSQSQPTLAHKSAFSSFVCQAGSASGNFRRKK